MNRGEHQSLRATTTFSRMNWPAPDHVLAKRARGKVLRGMILALLGWAKGVTMRQTSLETAITVRIRPAAKR